jgi:hypothetical protein
MNETACGAKYLGISDRDSCARKFIFLFSAHIKCFLQSRKSTVIPVAKTTMQDVVLRGTTQVDQQRQFEPTLIFVYSIYTNVRNNSQSPVLCINANVCGSHFWRNTITWVEFLATPTTLSDVKASIVPSKRKLFSKLWCTTHFLLQWDRIFRRRFA